MSYQPKIIAFAGSLRRESFNKKLINYTADLARDCGADVNVVDLNEFEMPVFNEDLEAEGTPESVIRLREQMIEAARQYLPEGRKLGKKRPNKQNQTGYDDDEADAILLAAHAVKMDLYPEQMLKPKSRPKRGKNS